MLLQLALIENERLLDDLSDASDDITDNPEPRLWLQHSALGPCQPAFGSGSFPFGLKTVAQFIQVNVEIVTGLIFGQRNAVAIEDLAANGGNAHGAVGLGDLILTVFAMGKHLHRPQPSE